jgi:hypothetical protein
MPLEFNTVFDIATPDGAVFPAGTPLTRLPDDAAAGFLEHVLRAQAGHQNDLPLAPFDGYAVMLPNGYPLLLEHEELQARRPALRVIRWADTSDSPGGC